MEIDIKTQGTCKDVDESGKTAFEWCGCMYGYIYRLLSRPRTTKQHKQTKRWKVDQAEAGSS